MTRPDGTPVNAVFGFTNMLAKLLREHVGTHLAVIFDAGRETFRNRIYDQYKAQRPPPPEELIPQFALVREATDAFGVPAIELADWEADDLIASYARAAVEAGGTVTIVSSDKDLMQLLRPGVEMLDPIKQKPIGPPEVMEKFGVTPDKLIEAQALIGDSVDNVPGVPGIGPKTAAQLLNEFGDLEGVLAAAPAMKPSKRRDLLIEHADKARLSRVLVTLRADAPLPMPLEALHPRPTEPGKLAAWLTTQGFRSIVTRMGLTDAPAPPVATAVAAPKQAQFDLGGAPPPPAVCAPLVAPEGFGPYETVTTADALRAWVAEATARGTVALDTETDGLDPMRAALVGILAGNRAVPRLLCAAAAHGAGRADRAGRRARDPVAAADRSVRAEGVAERQVRHAGAAARRLSGHHAARRHDDDLVRAGGRVARPRHGRAGATAPGPHPDLLRRGHRHRAQSYKFR